MTAKKDPRKILAWHFLPDDGRLRWGTREKVVVGKTYSLPADQMPELCARGMHGSIRALDALRYAPGAIVCQVKLWGDLHRDSDKIVARHREVIAMADATRTLHEFAVWCAREALRKYVLKPDPRSLKALDVKLAWLDGKATDAELAASWDAAWAAAQTTAWNAAQAAAWNALLAAAWNAAQAAARAASWAAAGDAAGAAAGDAARAEQNVYLEAQLCALCVEER